MRKSLTKQEIVKKKPEIDAIFRKGKKFSCPGVRLMVAPNGRSVDRIVVIPVRHYGNSVERNRIRRQIKEIWRNEKPSFRPGFDFAFVVYPGKVLDHETQRKQLTDLFSQAKVYLND
ncbi:MAG: ribonuclease P protein component [Sphaerochaetaceae bacterium]|nr:ribonuclease P protein component [Sphaerochaetaceae bacterium]MDD3941164.1 ribonuclease P protein component [Sphaerochaetaceae bacterium]MDX9938845.1 ribonuclease P protein component [Sphaerochaetaceae bacterium]